MNFTSSGIAGLYTISLKKIEDSRGLFARTYDKKEFEELGFQKEFVQFNHSFNKEKGTVRGMHYQEPPYAETKLIRCIQGAVYDVAVDIRKDSPTFLQYFGVELSESNMLSVIIPEGFAHGFQALEDNSALIYHHTAYFTPEADSGIRFDDPKIKIVWPLPLKNVSGKDLGYDLIGDDFAGIKL